MKKAILAAVVGLFLSGCATTHEGSIMGKVGAIGGAAAGAVIGHQSGHASEGAAIGATVGLLGGQAYGDTVGGIPEKREREAISRRQVVETLNDASSAYAACINNARAQRRDETYCRRIKYAGGLERPPTTGDSKTDELFGFSR